MITNGMLLPDDQPSEGREMKVFFYKGAFMAAPVEEQKAELRALLKHYTRSSDNWIEMWFTTWCGDLQGATPDACIEAGDAYAVYEAIQKVAGLR